MNFSKEKYETLVNKYNLLSIEELKVLYNDWDYFATEDFEYLKLYLPTRLFDELCKNKI
jgi:hypothetical protein